jgi:hypothetical protein
MNYEEQRRELEREGRLRVAHLMPLLRGRRSLWHRTDIEGMRAILKDGAIRPNDGTLPSGYITSEDVGHAGYRFGAVCLLDFDTAPLKDVYWAAQHWHQFLSSFNPATVVFELARDALATDALIQQDRPNWMPPQHRSARQGDHYPHWIPHVEAWHRGPIPLSAVGEVFVFRSGSGDKFERVILFADAVSTVEAFAARWAKEDAESTARAIAAGGIDIAAALAAARRRRSE